MPDHDPSPFGRATDAQLTQAIRRLEALRRLREVVGEIGAGSGLDLEQRQDILDRHIQHADQRVWDMLSRDGVP